jgi:transposase-like protein
MRSAGMSPPNRERVAEIEIARATAITSQKLYNWRSQWQKQGPLVPPPPSIRNSGALPTSWLP